LFFWATRNKEIVSRNLLFNFLDNEIGLLIFLS
jgi:hypothetical protein